MSFSIDHYRDLEDRLGRLRHISVDQPEAARFLNFFDEFREYANMDWLSTRFVTTCWSTALREWAVRR
jgi:hypothetical protein